MQKYIQKIFELHSKHIPALSHTELLLILLKDLIKQQNTFSATFSRFIRSPSNKKLTAQLFHCLSDSQREDPILSVIDFLNLKHAELSSESALARLMSDFFSIYQHYRYRLVSDLLVKLDLVDVWNEEIASWFEYLTKELTSYRASYATDLLNQWSEWIPEKSRFAIMEQVLLKATGGNIVDTYNIYSNFQRLSRWMTRDQKAAFHLSLHLNLLATFKIPITCKLIMLTQALVSSDAQKNEITELLDTYLYDEYGSVDILGWLISENYSVSLPIQYLAVTIDYIDSCLYPHIETSLLHVMNRKAKHSQCFMNKNLKVLPDLKKIISQDGCYQFIEIFINEIVLKVNLTEACECLIAFKEYITINQWQKIIFALCNMLFTRDAYNANLCLLKLKKLLEPELLLSVSSALVNALSGNWRPGPRLMAWKVLIEYTELIPPESLISLLSARYSFYQQDNICAIGAIAVKQKAFPEMTSIPENELIQMFFYSALMLHANEKKILANIIIKMLSPNGQLEFVSLLLKKINKKQKEETSDTVTILKSFIPIVNQNIKVYMMCYLQAHTKKSFNVATLFHQIYCHYRNALTKDLLSQIKIDNTFTLPPEIIEHISKLNK